MVSKDEYRYKVKTSSFYRKLKSLFKFRNFSLKNKLIFIFIFVSILPILTLQTISYIYSSTSIQNKISELSHENLLQTEKNLDTTITSYQNLVFQIITNEEVINMTKKLASNSLMEKINAETFLSSELSKQIIYNSGIEAVAIISTDGNIVVSDKNTTSPISKIWSQYKDPREIKAFSDAIKSDNIVIGSYKYSNAGNNKNLINFSMRITNLYSVGSTSGVIIISIDESVISDVCSFLITTKSGYEAKNATFVVDKDGMVISSPNGKLIGNKIFKNGEGTSREKSYIKLISDSSVFISKNFLINTLYHERTGWTIINSIDKGYLFSEMYNFQKVTVIFGIIVIIFSILIITYVAYNFSKSIKSVVDTMKVVQQGELTALVKFETKDEITIISTNFNRMMGKINELVEKLKYQIELTCIAVNKQRKAEIMALEAQINPHFLYNTLDSINWMAIQKKEYEISGMLKSLAQILRYSINKSNEITVLSEELNWIEHYMFLQKYRFNNAFEYKINIDQNLLGFKIYKLLLQPLIENAIIHGFEETKKDGLLTINIFKESGFLNITIEDNGKGIEKQKLEKLNDILKANTMTDDTVTLGIGILNVLERSRIYYGQNASIELISELGYGTKVNLKISLDNEIEVTNENNNR